MTEAQTDLNIKGIYSNFTRRFRRHMRSDERFVTHGPDWIKGLIHPLAKRMAAQMAMTWASLGPAGLTRAVFVTFNPPGEDGHSDKSLHLVFEPGDFFGGERAYLLIRDYKAPVKPDYKPGTVGHLNGMHIPTVRVPEDADLDWFKSYMS